MAQKKARTLFQKRVGKAIIRAVIVTFVITGFLYLAPIMFASSRGGPLY